jgi:hypothetical protein
MPKLFDRVSMEVSGTPGTGSVTLGAATTGYQTFADAGVSDNDFVHVVFLEGDAWEISTATYSTTGPSLTDRNLIQSSTGSLLSLTSAATLFCSPDAKTIRQSGQILAHAYRQPLP